MLGSLVDRMRARLLTLLYCLAATGCASRSVYPSDWPERSKLTDCRITGTYQDEGELLARSGISPGQHHAHLSWLLREGNLGPFDDLANPEIYVSLDRDSPKMRVGPERSAQIELLESEGGLVCESDGALTLRLESVTATSYRHAAITLWSAADESLIVRMGLSFTEKGVGWLLPDSYEVFWFRFRRMQLSASTGLEASETTDGLDANRVPHQSVASHGIL